MALIKLGAKLYFDSENKRDLFKHDINKQTTIGSYADSGDHLRGSIEPMNDYDTQSVILSLKYGTFNNDGDVKFSKKETYYKDVWSNQIP
ncbi:MAG: hypothetical protein CMK89_21450 [Pseudomonadales bacterium]|nr:hypothetical protein [Pseudomonadales bacterium]